MKRIAKRSWRVLPFLISFELGLSVVFGYGIAKLFAGPAPKKQGLMRSLVIELESYRVHFHHWLLSLAVLVFALGFNFFLVTPFLFYGFLGGIMLQGIIEYDDWRDVIMRRK